MSSNLDHKSNFITALALVFGGLSLSDQITFVVGLIVLALAGVSNYYSMKKNKTQKELADEQLRKIKKQNEK